MRALLFALTLGLIAVAVPEWAKAGEACDRFAAILTTTPAPPQQAQLLRRAELVASTVPVNLDTVLLGDSMVAGWPLATAKEIFPADVIHNLGVSGDRTQNVLWRLSDPRMHHLRPKTVVLLLGTNNLGAGDPPCAIYSGLVRVVELIDELWMRPRIYFIFIPPRGIDMKLRQADRDRVNNDMAEYMRNRGKGMAINIDRQMTDDPDAITRNLQPDRLHLTQHGYAAIRDQLMLAIKQSRIGLDRD